MFSSLPLHQGLVKGLIDALPRFAEIEHAVSGQHQDPVQLIRLLGDVIDEQLECYLSMLTENAGNKKITVYPTDIKHAHSWRRPG
jgi:hypothetical protein